MRLKLALALLVALQVTGQSVGDGCVPSTSRTLVEVHDTGIGTFYVVSELCQPGCLFDLWIYQEANGIEGLQRSDAVRDDTCGGKIRSDAMIS